MTQSETTLSPPLTRDQAAARRRQDAILDARYPGHHVAFLDEWRGDALDRRVVASAEDALEFQELLAALPPEIMDRIQLTLIPDNDSIPAPSSQLA